MNTEYERYRTDKLIDYFKFIASLHLAVIGVVVTFHEKFLSSTRFEEAFWLTTVTLTISFLIVTHGYATLINSYFEQIKHHKKIATAARKWSGYILVGSVLSFAIQVTSF